MSDLALDAIKLRYCGSTPGTWRHGDDGQSIITDGEDPAPPHYGGKVVCESIGRLDREWIIAARTDVPALVAEVERLRQGIQELADLHSEGIVRDELICLLYDAEPNEDRP